MNKKSLRAVLLLAVTTFTLNLLLFNYSQYVILPLLGTLLFLVALIGLGDVLTGLFKIDAAGVLDKGALVRDYRSGA